jgi:hypothetical protein
MLSLFRRPSRKPAPSTLRPVRLLLETLEDRNSPSQISLSVAYNPNHVVTLSGQVTATGPNPHADGTYSGVTVVFSGAVTGAAETDGSGNFSVSLTADSLGQVNAQTEDGCSNVASVTLTANTPAIANFSVYAGYLNYYTFTGTVTGDVTGGMAVSFGGQVSALSGQSVSVDANGNFCITVKINPNDVGSVSATASDWWGIYSDTAYVLMD